MKATNMTTTGLQKNGGFNMSTSIKISNEDIYNTTEAKMVKRGYKLHKVDNNFKFERNYFKIKGFKNWSFGIFIRFYYMEGTKNAECIHFFAIHNDNIDKFRPSSAVWKYAETIEDFEGEWSFMDMRIDEILKAIKLHPIFAFLYDRGGDAWTFKSPPIVRYILDRISEKFGR